MLSQKAYLTHYTKKLSLANYNGLACYLTDSIYTSVKGKDDVNMRVSISENGYCLAEFEQLSVYGREAVGGYSFTFILRGIRD